MKTEIVTPNKTSIQKIGSTTKVINWFEIPVADTARAKKFYETILDIKMQTEYADDTKDEVTFFPSVPGSLQAESSKSSGVLLKSDSCKPSTLGIIAYLNANPSIQTVIDKIVKAGGKMIVPKTRILTGFLSLFSDTEGNRVALHSIA